MVTRAQEDPRFQPDIDRSGATLALNVMATAMVTDGVDRRRDPGLEQDHRRRDVRQRDRELLEGVAALAAVSLRNARLHGAEQAGGRAGGAARHQPRDHRHAGPRPGAPIGRPPRVTGAALRPRAVGLYEKGHCDIRAVSGEEKIDPKDPRLQDLVGRAEWAAGRGESLFLSDRTAPGSDAERMFITIFGPDLERTTSGAGSTSR